MHIAVNMQSLLLCLNMIRTCPRHLQSVQLWLTLFFEPWFSHRSVSARAIWVDLIWMQTRRCFLVRGSLHPNIFPTKLINMHLNATYSYEYELPYMYNQQGSIAAENILLILLPLCSQMQWSAYHSRIILPLRTINESERDFFSINLSGRVDAETIHSCIRSHSHSLNHFCSIFLSFLLILLLQFYGSWIS